jgi:hypothetical protein
MLTVVPIATSTYACLLILCLKGALSRNLLYRSIAAVAITVVTSSTVLCRVTSYSHNGSHVRRAVTSAPAHITE